MRERHRGVQRDSQELRERQPGVQRDSQELRETAMCPVQSQDTVRTALVNIHTAGADLGLWDCYGPPCLPSVPGVLSCSLPLTHQSLTGDSPAVLPACESNNQVTLTGETIHWSSMGPRVTRTSPISYRDPACSVSTRPSRGDLPPR